MVALILRIVMQIIQDDWYQYTLPLKKVINYSKSPLSK